MKKKITRLNKAINEFKSNMDMIVDHEGETYDLDAVTMYIELFNSKYKSMRQEQGNNILSRLFK